MVGLARKSRMAQVVSLTFAVIFLLIVVYGAATAWHASRIPPIYIITPTYARPNQKVDLTTRLSHALQLARGIHWIVVEDSDHKTTLVANLLSRTSLPYTHLHIPTPDHMKRQPHEEFGAKPRGVLQRNEGLRWLREELLSRNNRDGFLYFADDDNGYDLELFDEIRTIKNAGVWPVAFAVKETERGKSACRISERRFPGKPGGDQSRLRCASLVRYSLPNFRVSRLRPFLHIWCQGTQLMCPISPFQIRKELFAEEPWSTLGISENLLCWNLRVNLQPADFVKKNFPTKNFACLRNYIHLAIISHTAKTFNPIRR
ncbi:hypothetical protein RvY_03152-1 [Ramazzottius varieornatus]|uniref:Galactosylgalactosylxylosylprotein 3-beta-glucuronosyltransferase n=1 Tax=Ramazzottius varieornatus TaxID=947166 RepID=A0A1D1UM17_RAMVA|nr:hypothetical protein RvY_03152-1 [Ramazzottius varieornatus]